MMPILPANLGSMVLQTSGSTISWELIFLIGMAGCTVVALAWLYLANSAGGGD